MISIPELFEKIYQWNPLNIYGTEVDIDDLFYFPLMPNETLMEDGDGICRRIKIPPQESTLMERLLYWLQIHLNKKGHLEAIDKLISGFYQKLLAQPPEVMEELQEYNKKIEHLRSLKNDYQFVQLNTDSNFIDLRLKAIGEQAYSIFSFYYRKQVNIEEELRRQVFRSFNELIKGELEYLNEEHLYGMIKSRFLVFVPTSEIDHLFEERVHSLDERLNHVNELYAEIDELERTLEGKFTISCLTDQLNIMRMKLKREVGKLGVELQLLMKSVIYHYHLASDKEAVSSFLEFMEFDINELQRRKAFDLFQEAISGEIKRMKQLYGQRREKAA